jgi:type III secretion protein C
MKILSVLTLTLASALCSPTLQASIPWQGNEPFFLSSRGSKLADILRDFGAHYAIPVVVSKQVTDPFIGVIASKPPAQVLDQLARLHNLAWYYDGQAIYVYKSSEVGRRLLTPTYLSTHTLVRQLKQSGLLDKRQCQIRAIPGSNALQVEGVPICLERVEALAKRVDEQKLTQDQNQEEIRRFPLKYANAADSSYTYRGQQVIIPGMVSMLKEMAQGRTLPLEESQALEQQTDRALPMFSADVQQNAVIVRDRRINLPIYQKLIADFDRKPTLIEISVMIMDVNTQELSKLGIDWSVATQIGGGKVSFNNGGQPASNNFSSIISNTGNFMIQLNALQENAKAQVLSRPSVVTLENTEAVLDRSVTFHTKLLTENVAKLESITTGSILRVTPRVIEENGYKEMMLKLVIQDGRQLSAISEQEPLPQTLNSEVSTQTLLRAGQSLLLGGFIQDEQSEGERKIPLLGDIPFIGKLFTTTQKNNRSTVRLFLIKAEPSLQR